MNLLQKLQLRFRALFQKPKFDAQMDDEMRSHIEMQTQENIDAGMKPNEARYAAMRQFGWVESIKETCRDQRGVRWIENLGQDVRFGARMLRKNLGFTTVAVLTLALGIGANSAIFSVINGVILKPLPYEQPGKLVTVWEDGGNPGGRSAIPGGVFKDWREHSKSFEALSVMWYIALNLTGDGRPERINGWHVSATFLDIFRLRPTFGRGFLPDDDKLGQDNKVVVLNHGFWQRRFGGDTNLVGKQIRLNDEAYTVIGILPAKKLPLAVDFLVPFVFGTAEWQNSRIDQRFMVYGRLKPSVTIEQAQADLKVIREQLKPLYPDWKQNWGATLVPLRELVTGQIKPTLLVLFGAVGFVLLIACANVANLLLARAAARQREIAMRAALGASRWRITSQLLTESVMLAIIGGTLGVGLAFLGVQVISHVSEATLPRAAEVRLDLGVLAFSLSISLLTGFLFGLVPALQTAKPDLNATLKEGGRGSSFGPRNRLRSSLIVSEIALALVLLVGAGLLLHSFVRLLSVPTGFNPHRAVAMDISLSERKYSDDQRQAQAVHQMFQSIESLPGVEAAGTATTLPLGGGNLGSPVAVEGRANQPEGGYNCSYDFVAGRYFQAIGIPVLKGRVFVERDNSTNAPRTAILNEALAKKAFPTEEPVGQRVRFWGEVWEIIGIVGDVRQDGLNLQAAKRIYLPQAFGGGVGTLIVRTRSDPSALIDPIRKAILLVDPEQPVSNIRTLEQAVERSVAGRRLLLTLVGIFASAALALAAIGLYGVMAYTISQRTQEIGIRMALGAQRRDVLKLMVGTGMRMALIGVVIGVIGSLGLTRVIQNQLYSVGPTDPITFVGISLLLLAVALLACWVPARRAAKIQPIIALRYE